MKVPAFSPRLTTPLTTWSDPDGLKLYTISATGEPVAYERFVPKLDALKRKKPFDWSATPAFAIFHEGATLQYLVLAWWANDNELFTSVSVFEAGEWIEAPDRYSFCIWDLEVIWHERNSFIKHLYSGERNIESYRADLRL